MFSLGIISEWEHSSELGNTKVINFVIFTYLTRHVLCCFVLDGMVSHVAQEAWNSLCCPRMTFLVTVMSLGGDVTGMWCCWDVVSVGCEVAEMCVTGM